MQQTLANLLARKAQLYAILAVLSLVLLVAANNVYFNSQQPETEFYCGTVIEIAPYADHPDYQAGKTLFAANCAACHNKNMQDDLAGPALGGLEERWAAYPRQDLYDWIRHSQRMIRENHPRAQELWWQWKSTVMNDFPGLTDEQIEQLLVYIGP